MSDITKCPGTGCSVSHKCYRHNARPSWRQSWLAETPGRDENCPYFWADELYELFNLSQPPEPPPETRTTT